MAEVGQDGQYLVGGAEGGDQGTDGRTVLEVVEELELVQDALRRGGNVDLLDGDVLGTSAGPDSLRCLRGVVQGGGAAVDVPLEWRGRPLFVFLIQVPFVVVGFILKVLSLVDGGECA